MKKYLVLLCLLVVGLSACKKSSDTFDAAAQAAADETAIKAYMVKYNIPAIKDPSGLYYQIIAPGEDTHPTLSSGITVAYTAKLMSTETIVDKQTSFFFDRLGDLIDGWKVGISKVGKNGHVLLLIPSGLGYKNEDHGTIPANSVLVYDITLQGFTN